MQPQHHREALDREGAPRDVTPSASLQTATAQSAELQGILYWINVVDCICLPVFWGVQAMYLAFLFFGQRTVHLTELQQLTQYVFDNDLYHPEREIPIYLVTLVAIVIGTAIYCRGRSLPGRGRPEENEENEENEEHEAHKEHEELPGYQTVQRLLCGTVGMILFAATFCGLMKRIISGAHWHALYSAILLMVWLGIWIVTAMILRRNALQIASARLITALTRWGGISAVDERLVPGGHDRRWRRFTDIMMPFIIIMVIYIPRIDTITGDIYRTEHMHHWDFFLMGPAIGYLNGGRLATDIYTQYSLGYPVLLRLLARFQPITYGHVLQFTLAYACLYFYGIYLLLRLLCRSALWSAVGTLLAMDLVVFHGLVGHSVIWRFPSSTILRSPCDVWFFLALAWDARDRRPKGLYLAGLMAGTALFMETDTGIYLGMTLFVYWILTYGWPRPNGVRSQRQEQITSMLVTLSAALLVMLPTFWVASRGSLFSRQFLVGWLEVFRLYPSGISMLPVASNREGVSISMVFISTYLLIFCVGFAAFRNGSGTKSQAVRMCLALYGLLYLLQYIGRSHPANIYHVSIPFSLLCIDLLARCCPLGRDTVRKVSHALCFVLLALPVAHLLLSPSFREYPSLLRCLFIPPPPPTGVWLFPDERDIELAGSDAATRDRFRLIVTEANQLAIRHQTILFLVNNEPIYHLASHSSPSFRYAPLLDSLLTQSMATALIRDIERGKIDYIFVPEADPNDDADKFIVSGRGTSEIWSRCHTAMQYRYQYIRDVGKFEIWRRIPGNTKL